MLLNRLRGIARHAERGAALVTVLAVVAITAIVGVTITASVLSANGYTTSTRADLQSRAAADAGIDATFSSIYGGSYVCSAALASTDLTYTATVAYKDAAGASLPCSGATVVGTPASAVIRSTGISVDKATKNTTGNSHIVSAAVTIIPAASNGDLDKGVFSESGFTLTNNTTLVDSGGDANDANVYSNGTIICKTQVTVEGVLYSQGDISLENSCKTYSDVWAGGKVTFSSQAVANGDVYAAGTGTLDLSTGHVMGSIITNGSVTMSNNAGVLACPSSAAAKAVCGSVVSLGGSIYASNGATIGGSAFAKSAVTLNNMNGVAGVGRNVISSTDNFVNDSNSNQAGRVAGWVKVAGTIGGYSAAMADKSNSCQGSAGNGFVKCSSTPVIPAPDPEISLPATLGYPTTGTVNKPPREQMPRINSGSTDLAAWLADGWTITTYNASTASASGKSSCQQAKDLIATKPTGKNLVVVRDCSSAISWDNSTIELAGDLAVMSHSGFNTQNVLTIKSNGSTVRALMFIVPADATYVTWNPVAGTNPTQYTPTCANGQGGVSVNNVSVTNVAWLVYTPCAISFQNQLSGFRGQLYGGSVNYPNNSTMQLVRFSVPGVTSSVSTPSNSGGTASITSRVDVNGG